MDHPTCGESSQDSSDITRPPVKKRKRTRMNVDHLTDEEKCLRKRFLGRERARRYREKKRETDGNLPRRVGRPKSSQRKKTGKLRFLLPSSGVFYRRVLVHVDKPSSNSTYSPKFPASSFNDKKNEEHSSILTLKNEGEPSVAVTDSASLQQIKKINAEFLQSPLAKKDQQHSLKAPNSLETDAGEVRKTRLSNAQCMNMEESREQDGSLINTEELPALCLKEETCLQIEESEVCPKLAESSAHTDPTDSTDSDENELTKTPIIKSKKQIFKQQNVKDFINFFPVSDSRSIDTGSFVTGSSGLQKQVEYVPHAKKLMSKSNLSDLRWTEKPKQSPSTADCKDVEREQMSTPEQLESKEDVDDNISKKELTEKPTTSESVDSAPAQAPALTEISLTSVPTILSVPVSESASAQHLAQGGLHLAQLSSLLQQQQLLSVAANSQTRTCNTLDQTILTSGVNADGKSDGNNIPSLPGIVCSSNLQATGSGLGMQSLVGNTGYQGLSDPRLLQIAGLQGSVQNVPSLLGLTALQGVLGGLQGTTAALASPSGIVGLQGIQNLQALSGLQGIPGLHAVNSLQGLVSLQGIPSYPGIQGLQGVGIAGPQVRQGLQALAALQGNTYLQSITGASGLISGLSSQPAIFGPPVSLNQDSMGNNQQVISDKDEKNQVVSDFASTTIEGTSLSESKKNQLIQMVNEDKEQSRGLDTTPCSESKPMSRTSTPSTPRMSQAQKGRSRRKQASPRCISKQWWLSSDSEDMENEGQKSRDCTSMKESFFGEVDQHNESVLSASLCGVQTHSPKSTDCETASTSLMEASKAPIESPRPGSKLSKKVDELISATKPRQLDIHCSSSLDPEDDGSPSPQTWKRFLEREKQRSDRLREVEDQLAKLKAMTWQWQVASKCLVSTATQTDIDWLTGHQQEVNDRPPEQQADQDEELWQSMVEVTDQREGGHMIHGQIQQRLVTSSGDSHVRNLSRDGSQHEAELADTLPVIVGDRHRSSEENQSSPQACSDAKTRIINRPFNICTRSYNKGRKARRGPVGPSVAHQANLTSLDDHQGSSDQESMESGNPFTESSKDPPNIPKYVLQVVPRNYSSTGETSEIVYGNGQAQLIQIPSFLSESSGDVHLNSVQEELTNSSLVVPPWEAQGLSKIERNRIRAREGMRRHREKLRQAKLASQIWWNQCVKLDNPSCGELSRSVVRSRKMKVSGCVSERTPSFVDAGKISRGSRNQNTTAAMFESQSLAVQGFQKKPFEVLAQVGVSAETDLEIKQEVFESPKPFRVEANQREMPQCLSTLEFDKGSQKSPSLQGETKRLPNPEKAGSGGSLVKKIECIDFSQEPFRSMSLQERNRIRAREGMRRYRERLKQTRESSLQVYKMGKSGRGRGARKGNTSREVHKNTLGVNSAPAAKHLAELAKRHSGTLVPCSEGLERNKSEVRKRKRLKSNASHQDLVQVVEIDLKRHQLALPDSGSYKQDPVVIKNEPLLTDRPEQTTQDSVSKEVNYPILTRQRTSSSMLQGSATAVSISDECQGQRHFDSAVVKQSIKEKVAYGMDRYTAIRSSVAAGKRGSDYLAPAGLCEEEKTVSDS